ncbi:MAG: hypothetical protein AB2807_05545, partial [Candidatus Sedimenticola endophacoides]
MITRKYTTALLVLTLILGAYYLHTSDLRLQRLTEQYAQESASILDQQLQTFKLHLRDQECRYLVKDFGTSQSPKSTRQRDSRYCPD